MTSSYREDVLPAVEPENPGRMLACRLCDL